MVFVPAGAFYMGTDTGPAEERPRHRVHLDGFEIDRCEVTNERFLLFINARGYEREDLWNADGWRWRTRENVTKPQFWHDGAFNQPAQPVVGVSWFEADAFCRLTQVRLPSEAEWEKTARGIEERIYPWGNQWDPQLANGGTHSTGPVAVGAYPRGASAYGALDLAGNVWEWVNDWYDATYYAQSPSDNPSGPGSGREKVWRGGSYRSTSPDDLRSLRRDFMTIDVPKFLRPTFVGFRCARSVRSTGQG
jgi:formylglycine-generating enzyme required for sulfatase activity